MITKKPPPERKLKNWLDTYINWIKPRSEASENLIIWSGIATLASVLKRKVVIPKFSSLTKETVLGTYSVHPNIYVFIVGPSGVRKTTAMEMSSDELLHEVSSVNMVAQSASQESLMKKLTETDDFSLTIMSKEFGNLYKVSGPKILEFLTALFDGNRSFDNLTIARGVELALNPSTVGVFATTPEWIAENFTMPMLQGGFAGRCIWLYVADTRVKRMFFSGQNSDILEKRKHDLIHDLIYINDNIKGEVMIHEEERERIEAWYQNYTRTELKTLDHRIHGYANRKHRHALAVAMCLHFGYSDTLELTYDEFMAAVKLLDMIEPDMPKIFSGVGKNPYTLDLEQVVEYVRIKKQVPRKLVLARFSSVATPEALKELIDGLCEIGILKVSVGETGIAVLSLGPLSLSGVE